MVKQILEVLKKQSAEQYMTSVQKVSSYVIRKSESLLKKIQETSYIGQWFLSPLRNRPPWDLTQFSQSPSAALSYFPKSHWVSEISSPSKVILVLGRAKKSQGAKSGLYGGCYLGDFRFCQKLGSRCDGWAGGCEVVMKLPITVAHTEAFWIIQIVSMEECSSLTQNLMQICCSTCSVILNVTATQYTGSLNGIYCPHWPVQWSHHCSCMCIPVHSPWLPGYLHVVQTFLLY